MSFSSTIKEELVRIKLRNHVHKTAQLAGLTHGAGSLRIGKPLGVDYITETHAVGKHIVSLATSLYDLDATLALREQEHRRARATVVSLSGNSCLPLLSDVGILSQTPDGIQLLDEVPASLVKSDECKRAFLRGLFLGCGSCSDPARTYHLEMICRNSAFAQTLLPLINEYDCNAKISVRKGKYIIYLKEADRIATFLAIVGASASILAFEDIRAEKDLRNYINRTSNCETANIGKTVFAATDQLYAIRLIQQTRGLSTLPLPLQEAAELRLNHPESSLQSLADMAGIGKSGMNHRLRRICQLAHDIELQNG